MHADYLIVQFIIGSRVRQESVSEGYEQVEDVNNLQTYNQTRQSTAWYISMCVIVSVVIKCAYVKGKGKGMFLYSSVSSPLDR